MDALTAMKQALEAMERYQVKRQDFDMFAGEIFALQTEIDAQNRQEQQADKLKALVHRQLQWQKHRDSVGIVMSDSEYAWIADAEATLSSNL